MFVFAGVLACMHMHVCVRVYVCGCLDVRLCVCAHVSTKPA